MSHTRRRRPVAWVLAVVVAFAFGVLASWMLWSSTGGPNQAWQGGSDATAGDGESFAISGDLTQPVSPGVSVALDLAITNTHADDLIVSGVIVSVQSIDAPNATTSRPCSADDYTVQQMPASQTLLIGSETSSTLAELDVAMQDWPQVGMVDSASNQDGCKAASLELVYTATGKFDR